MGPQTSPNIIHQRKPPFVHGGADLNYAKGHPKHMITPGRHGTITGTLKVIKTPGRLSRGLLSESIPFKTLPLSGRDLKPLQCLIGSGTYGWDSVWAPVLHTGLGDPDQQLPQGSC